MTQKVKNPDGQRALKATGSQFDSYVQGNPEAEQENFGPIPVFDNIKSHLVSPYV